MSKLQNKQKIKKNKHPNESKNSSKIKNNEISKKVEKVSVNADAPSKPSILTKKTISKTTSKLPDVKDFWNLEVKQNSKKQKAVEDDDDSRNVKKQRLTGAERYQRYIDEEERIRKIEEELADPNIDPHTPDQFERALLKDRNSSFMWIKYMAFHLETAETEKARAVAKRALAAINFREEGELLNVWIALLNLEIRFGTDDNYNETLREAVQRNDPFKVYSRTLTVLLEMEKFEESNNFVDILKKKFKPLPDMWLQVSEAYLKMKNEKQAKEILPKSLLSLKERDHVEYMVKYALMASRYDLNDFSQTIFEKILSSYNKKLPVWFTYINMMTKTGEVDIARSLFERILVIQFPMKKLKTIFQKYVEFETRHGNASNISKIKKMARNMLEQEAGSE
ncbi:CLUMA_CG012479, isoform A [Clunio marinus]|uniref:CLUMA_CG012479, isoform A n=1 Tax=Clunio marinus TaxID=568069 RepID=A0A1J1IL07_9DIPT|nr:CLUMA_CG012479, isoform A [Clunio marinus]